MGVWLRVWMSVRMCVWMCVQMRVWMCVQMRVNVRVNAYVDAGVNAYVHGCVNVCVKVWPTQMLHAPIQGQHRRWGTPGILRIRRGIANNFFSKIWTGTILLQYLASIPIEQHKQFGLPRCIHMTVRAICGKCVVTPASSVFFTSSRSLIWIFSFTLYYDQREFDCIVIDIKNTGVVDCVLRLASRIQKWFPVYCDWHQKHRSGWLRIAIDDNDTIF